VANDDHLLKLKTGVHAWFDWRETHPEIIPDLSGANLQDMDLHQANFIGVNLSGADLRRADLKKAYLQKAISLVNTSLENAQSIKTPTLILQGSDDIIVAQQCAKELYAKLSSLDKKLFILEGAGHWFHDALCPVEPRSKCDSKERQQFVLTVKKWLRSR